MNLQTHCSRNTPLTKPEYMDAAQTELPSLPQRNLDAPWPEMPDKMLIVIDGWSDTPKHLAGEWVAESLGGLFVNADKIFLSLVAACAKAGVDVNDYGRVASWCEKAAVDVGFAKDGGRALDAQVAINGSWFVNSELQTLGNPVSKRPAYEAFWDKVRQVVRGCDFDDRVVIVGSDIGYEFPGTPYRFFIDNTRGARNAAELAGLAYPWLGDRRNYDNPGPTYFDKAVKAVVVDAECAKAGDIVCIILVESVARAHEMGFITGPREIVVQRAYKTANAVRQRLNLKLLNDNGEG